MRRAGFTLAELLIALVILGMIATFTIPKILQAQQANAYSSNAKEVVSMVAGAYTAYKAQNAITDSTGIEDLVPYFNYVEYLGNSDVLEGEAGQTLSVVWCSASNGTHPCIRLHNGGVLGWRANGAAGGNFGPDGATPQEQVSVFYFDPDGEAVNNPTDGKGMLFMLSRTGHIRTRADTQGLVPKSDCCTWAYNPALVPSWWKGW